MARTGELRPHGAALERLVERLLRSPRLPGVAVVGVENRPRGMRPYDVAVARLACSGAEVSGTAVVAAWQDSTMRRLEIHRVGDGEYDETLPFAQCGSFGFMERHEVLWSECADTQRFRYVPDDNPYTYAARRLLEAVEAGNSQLLVGDPVVSTLWQELETNDHHTQSPLMEALFRLDPMVTGDA